MDSNTREIKEKMDYLVNLRRAPSQFLVFIHVLGKGKSITVNEISKEVNLTLKATERAVAKLYKKGILQKSSFKKGAYRCDKNEIILGLLLKISELEDKLVKISRAN